MHLLTINETADLLLVSPATIRNWLKTGRLTAQEQRKGKPMFSQQKILELKQALAAGADPSLKSRRNKSYVQGREALLSYLTEDSPNRQLARRLASHAEMSQDSLPRLLAGAARSLCAQRGLLEGDAKALTEQLLQELFAALGEPPEAALAVSEEDWLSLGSTPTYVEGEDFLGFVYSALQPTRDRKRSGAYFTPVALSRELNEKLFSLSPDSDSGDILDPACGTGSFLINLPSFVSFARIYGNDQDPVAIALAKLNCLLKYQNLTYEQLTEHFTCQDFLQLTTHRHFQHIIGNPPWGSHLDREQLAVLSSSLTTAGRKSCDVFDLFLEKGGRMLAPGGQLAFLLPQALLTVRSHERIRAFLLQQGMFRYVRELPPSFGSVNCPELFLVWEKDATKQGTDGIPGDAKLSRTDGARSLQPLVEDSQGRSIPMKEPRVFSPDFMPFFLSDPDYARLQRALQLKQAVYLKGHATFGLGIVTGDNRRLLHREEGPGLEPILTGSDVHPFRLADPSRFLRYEPESLQQTAPAEQYRSPKLVYRFINKGLVFALDEQGLLTLNSCNFLIPGEGLPTVWYLLAILNSQAAEFIFQNRFASLKVLRQHLEQLPIPLPTQDQERELAALARQLSVLTDPEEWREQKKRLDALAWELYLP